jgi:hypothetical protein
MISFRFTPAAFGRIATLLLLTAQALPAQVIRPSQAAELMQWVGASKIQIAYHRPVARGRELFGKLVPFGKVWSPSADTAIVFKTSKALKVNGSALPAGSYSIWAIPGAAEWTLMFSSVDVVHHMFYPEGKDVLRVKTVPRSGDYLETLAIYFPLVDADSAEMVIHWGRTVVPVKIRAGR